MTNSRRRTPIVPMTCATSEKDDKQRASRAFRRAERVAIQQGDEPPVRHGELGDIGNRWTWAKDGKQWWDHPAAYRK